MRYDNVLGRVCLCVCVLSLCNALTFESIELESLFMVYRYIFGILSLS